MAIVAETLGAPWVVFAGDRLLNAEVPTGTAIDSCVAVSNKRFLNGRVVLQIGHWGDVTRAEVAILDLNPRSLTAWILLLTRRALRRRTLVWGHLHPRLGAGARTAGLRRYMRQLADGCVLYSYAEASLLARISPAEQVWVAPNALYREADVYAELGSSRNIILYVGRLDGDKKPGLLLEAFALLAAREGDAELCLVGDGALLSALKERASNLGLATRVRFLGTLADADELRPLYDRARCSVSPGYCGLSLTQSLGFGVPMVVADAEPHAPEIELAALGFTVFFEAGSSMSLAGMLTEQALARTDTEREAVVKVIRSNYSAEAMAAGFVAAMLGTNPSRPAPASGLEH